MPSLQMRMLSPCVAYGDAIAADHALAQRPASLDGKVLGLIPNWRPAAVHLLGEIGTFTSVKELIAYAKDGPGQVNYASGGIGNSGHLAGALFGTLAGVELTHVPYKGTGLAMPDLLAGRVQIAICCSMIVQFQRGKHPIWVFALKR